MKEMQVPILPILAGLFGGIVRVISSKDKNKKFIHFFTGAVVGIFTGMIVFYLCKSYDINQDLTISLVALSGYIGAPLLDALTKVISKSFNLDINNNNNNINMSNNRYILNQNNDKNDTQN